MQKLNPENYQGEPKIKELSSEIIPKIAAGEVVERPASVVKELVENSLDAGAQSITIEIEEAGFKKIRVIDDGEGMIQKDLLRCFLPHHTSKITSIADLENIGTLGFRGEALASICSVCEVGIKTRVSGDKEGNEALIKRGSIEKTSPAGMKSGTVVEVQNLFSYVPARKKFLKSKNTEYRRVLDTVVFHALGNPTIGFKFLRDGKTVFNVSTGQNLIDRAKTLLGTEVAQNLLPVEVSNEYVNLKGFLGKPQISYSTKDHQFLFINGRAVKNKLISAAVKSAFNTLIEPKSHPVFIFFVELNAELVDVNIHPRKENIKFWNEEAVAEFMQEAVRKTLQRADLSYVKDDISGLDVGAAPYTFSVLKSAVEAWSVKDFDASDGKSLQVAKKFIVTVAKDGVLIVDQHAAHESILYEQFLEEFLSQKQKGAVFELRKPVVVNLSLSQADLLGENLGFLGDLGLEIEECGQNSFRVRSVPKMLRDREVTDLVVELLADLKMTGKVKDVDERSKRTIEFLACRGAIKAGEKLTAKEMKNLLEKLLKTEGLYTCPHGRPVMIKITLRELDRMFKRVK